MGKKLIEQCMVDCEMFLVTPLVVETRLKKDRSTLSVGGLSKFVPPRGPVPNHTLP